MQPNHRLSHGFPSCGAHTINDTQMSLKQPNSSCMCTCEVLLVIYEQDKSGSSAPPFWERGGSLSLWEAPRLNSTENIKSSVEFSDIPQLSLLRNFVILSFPKLSFILFHYLISFVAQIRIWNWFLSNLRLSNSAYRFEFFKWTTILKKHVIFIRYFPQEKIFPGKKKTTIKHHQIKNPRS